MYVYTQVDTGTYPANMLAISQLHNLQSKLYSVEGKSNILGQLLEQIASNTLVCILQTSKQAIQCISVHTVAKKRCWPYLGRSLARARNSDSACAGV